MVVVKSIKNITLALAIFIIPLFPVYSVFAQKPAQTPITSVAAACGNQKLLCFAPQYATVSDQLKALSPPSLADGMVTVVTYNIITRGELKADLSEFDRLSNETLNDLRGWSRMGLSFQKVASSGDFTLVLSQASQVPSFSPGCDSTYSCNTGNFVIINEDRWLGATEPWNNGGGSLRDYRHMVVNHETGHWLGQGHETCSGAGQPAAVMQQQSISLQGCSFNSWPLQAELYSTKLGI